MKRSFFTVFASRKMAALLLLGLSSGLPLFLSSQTLQAWMTQAKVDLGSIGLFSLVSLPYSLKFLWAPLVDRYVPPFLSQSLGRRRSWLVLMQFLLAIAIGSMFFQEPTQALQALAVNAVLIAFLSATQDIVADAYRSDVLEEAEMGAGIGVFVLGYRIALILTGSLAFILADRLSWPVTYLCLGVLMLLNIGVTLFAPEPQRDLGPPPTLLGAVWRPFQDFVKRLGWQRSIVILIFIVLYRYGDALLNNMATPFLLNPDTGLGYNPATGLGFTQTDIGAIKGGMGLIATIVGTLLGGSILSQIGISRSLWIFGGLQALSNVSYWILSQLGPNYAFMVLTINVENFCTGLATAGFIAFLMSLCNPTFSATQYALLSSLMAVSRDILVAPAGKLAEATGWPLFFLITLIAALPGLALLPWFAPWHSEPVMPRPGTEDPNV